MDIAIAILLTVAAATFVAWPFFAREIGEAPPEAQLSPLERQKVEAYSAIKEAEFDYQMGKLTETDFDALRERYSQQALAAIAAIQQARAAATPIGKASEGRRAARVAYCPSCGRAVPPRGNFCPGCGRGLSEAVA
jgi:hypothetical protein